MIKLTIIIFIFATILIFSIQCGDLVEAKGSKTLEYIKTETIKQIRSLQAQGINAIDNQGRTPLFIAAQYNLVNIIKELLQDKDIEIDKADNECLTPLAIAINEGHVEAVQILLSDKYKELFNLANFETRDRRLKCTPLARAAMTGNEEIIKLLLHAGANPTAVITKEGKDMPTAALYKLDDKEVTDLMKSKAKEYIERGLSVIKFLEDNRSEDARKMLALGIDVNAKNEFGCTPRHWAVFQGHKDIIELLINNKADINVQDDDGDTLLIIAARKRSSRYN